MESINNEQEPTVGELERKKLELEIEQLQKEARVPRFIRPGYLGPLLSALIAVAIPIVSFVYLNRSGFFDREKQILESQKGALELQKEQLKAEVRDFEGDKERLITENELLTAEKELLTREVVALGEKETALAEQLETTSGELREMQWAYFNSAVE
ncbi:MAG: hypothetical protein ACR2GR_05540, partial [Rhodothermales bacterium]